MAVVLCVLDRAADGDERAGAEACERDAEPVLAPRAEAAIGRRLAAAGEAEQDRYVVFIIYPGVRIYSLY